MRDSLSSKLLQLLRSQERIVLRMNGIWTLDDLIQKLNQNCTAIRICDNHAVQVIINSISSILILNMPDLTLYFLQASRSIRTAWLLEELGLDYKLETYDREDTGLAPARFKQSCGTALGKAPVLKDGNLTLQESGAITEYVCPPNYMDTIRFSFCAVYAL